LPWTQFLTPKVLVPAAIMTGTVFAVRHVYLQFFKRIPSAIAIGDDFWRRRSLFGVVTSVGDGDGFRLFHTPGGKLAGWGLLPWRRVPRGKGLQRQTISIRLAGVDAPERPHFGKAEQPGSAEALDWLTKYILNRRVRVYLHRKDQYDRAVATAFVRKGLIRRDVGLQLLRSGWATVYEANTGAEFGEYEAKYRRAEKWAQMRRLGIWRMKKKLDKKGGDGPGWETPREFKDRTKGD